MRAGFVYGYADMLDGLVNRMSAALGGAEAVIACGGISPSLVRFCGQEIAVDENLVMEGLKIIYHKNVRGES